MNERKLRKDCRKLLQQLDIAPPLDVPELCARIATRRGRPINLIPYPLVADGPFGCWVSAAESDYVFYLDSTTPTHQDHIILHELGHILADHSTKPEPAGSYGGDAVLRDFQHGTLPEELGQDAVRRALRRTAYDRAEEREAEIVATTIQWWASVVDRVSFGGGKQQDRLDAALGDRRIGWL